MLALDHMKDSELLRSARADISAELVDLWHGGPTESLNASLSHRGWQPTVTDIAEAAAACERPIPPAFDPARADAGRGLARRRVSAEGQPLGDVQPYLAVGLDVLPEQRGQPAAVGGLEQLGPCGVGEDVLEHQGVRHTVLVQSLLKDPTWAERLTDADRRALSPLFWSHANLYGTIPIDMETHLDLGLAA
ncbi:hypothetical protein [Nonomuraea rosea]